MGIRIVLVIGVAAVATSVQAAPPGAADIARSYVAGRPDLTGGNDLQVERISPSGLVKLRRTHRGVPILGGSVHVRLGPGGEVQDSSADRGVVPRELSVDPAVSASDAVRVASEGLHDDAQIARLIVWAMPMRKARLAWAVDLPIDWEKLEQPRVLIDAQRGTVLWRQDRLQRVKGKAYSGGAPGVGTLDVVDLSISPAGSTTLRNADVFTRNCIDMNTCPLSANGIKLHHCEMMPK